MNIFQKTWSLLLEALIIMWVINIMVVLIFGYIRDINEANIEHIHRQRATMLMMWTFEKIRSARDSAVNMSSKDWWSFFVQDIKDKYEIVSPSDLSAYYMLTKNDDGAHLEWQWRLVSEWNNSDVFVSEVAPFAKYRTYIQAYFPQDENDATKLNEDKVIFNVSIKWRDIESWANKEGIDKSYWKYMISDSLLLTNNKIYENLY